MQYRLAAFLTMAGFSGLVLGGWLAAGATSPQSGRISFQIATGSSGGTFFPVGQTIAGLISHPPGVDRCDAAPVCGPAGLVISVRTSQGAVDNVTEVNAGEAESGLAQSDVVAAAVKGQGPFRAKATHLRTIAALFNEDVHLIVAARSNIKGIADLRGKRVALGDEGAGATLTMHEILSAFGVAEKNLKLVKSESANNVALMQAGKIDAFFVVGDTSLAGLAGLFAQGRARLAPIDGKGRDQLLKTAPSFAAALVPANFYAGQAETRTVAIRALWIVRDSVADDLVYGITRALFHPANRNDLADSHPGAAEIDLAEAGINLPAPLHSGAARYYRSPKR